MEFRKHVISSLLFTLITLFIVQWYFSILIFLGHFIPTVDFIMKKVNFHRKFHRSLFHNIFAFTAMVIFYFLFFPIIVVILVGFNHLLHLFMDTLDHAGIAIFYPISKKRIRFDYGIFTR